LDGQAAVQDRVMGANGGSSQASYDAIVIGSGIAGLTAASLLAHGAWNVLLIEAGEAPGGYGHAFDRGGYRFDPAVHMIPEAPYVRNLLEYLGAADGVTLEPVDHLYGATFPSFHVDIPHEPGDRDGFIDAHAQAFPQEADRLRELFDVFERVFLEATSMPFRVLSADVDDMESRFPTLVRYRKATVQEVLDEYLTDDRLKAVVGAPWSYLGLPPSQLAFLLYAQMMNVLIAGSHYTVGGFQRVVDSVVGAFERSGGELRVGSKVVQILIEDGKARGVRLADDSEAFAPVVISGADGRHTLEKLVGLEHLPRGITQKLRRLKPSISAFLLFAGTRLDLHSEGAAHENFLFRHWSHDDTYSDILNGLPGGMSVNVPTILDARLAPPGEHAIIVRALAPYETEVPWPELKDRYTELVLAECDARFPGFSDALTFAEPATPEALARFTGNDHGACYGWANSPLQAGNRRLPHQPGVRGLYLAGHWTQEGTGCLRAMLSGITVVQEVLASVRAPWTVPDFRPRAMGGPMRENEQKKAIVRRFFEEVWNNGRFEFIDEMYAENFTLHALWQNTALGGSGETSGKEAAKEVIKRWRDGFPDVHISVEDQIVEGDVVTSRHVFSGTNESPFQGIPPTGRHGAISGITMTKVVDGKITDAWTMWDVVSLMRQLGVMPDPMDGERNKAVVHRLYEEVWNQNNADAADELLANDFEGRAAAEHPLAGPADVKALAAMWRAGLSNLHVEVEAAYAESDRVVTRYRITGVHTGPLLGVAPTGMEVSVAGMSIARLAEGKIVSDWGEMDLLGLLQQIGAVPMPGGAPPGAREEPSNGGTPSSAEETVRS
jgi:prolycopene isomerase